jgi:hypothetical protein
MGGLIVVIANPAGAGKQSRLFIALAFNEIASVILPSQ